MTSSSRPVSWLAVADVVGHCLFVFVFVPALTAIPAWVRFEVTNPLNIRDPIVLSFLLVRGFRVVLDAFYAGLVAGVVSGGIAGVLMCVVAWSGVNVTTRPKLYAIGAITGGVAACLMIVAVVAIQGLAGHAGVWGTIPFEIASGLVCGALSAPTAVRLLRET
jgi:hypothetical protein